MRNTKQRFAAGVVSADSRVLHGAPPERLSNHNLPPALWLPLVFALGCAHGQDLPGALACTRLSDDAARLSCYDAALRLAKPAVGAAGSPAPPPPATGNSAPQARFGDDGRFHAEAKPELPKNLTAQVREVVPLAGGLYRLALDNGQVWATTEADTAVAFKANDAITISRGLFNSYRISLTGTMTNVSVVRKK